MTKEALIEQLRRTSQQLLDERSAEGREELWPTTRPANFDWRSYFLEIRNNLDYVPYGIDLFEEDAKIQQEQIDRWLSHNQQEENVK